MSDENNKNKNYGTFSNPNQNTNIVDDVDGIILSDVFNQMNSNVTSPIDLKLNLEASFPAQSTQIEKLFNDYGY